MRRWCDYCDAVYGNGLRCIHGLGAAVCARLAFLRWLYERGRLVP